MTRLREAVALHPRHAIVAALATGLALSERDAIVLFVAAMLVTILLVACGSRAHVAVAACALLLAGGAIGSWRLAAIDADPLAQIGPGEVRLSGVLVQLPRQSAAGTTLRVRVSAPGHAHQTIEARSRVPPPAGARIGDGVALAGTLSAIDPRHASSPEAASYAKYLLRNGVRRRLRANAVVLTGTRRGGVVGVVDAIRARADRALAFGVEPEAAALLRGMVLGGDAGVPEATADDFRAAGLSHILAVSGQNVLLIVVLVQALMTAAGAGRSARIVTSAGVVCIYVALCGAQASVVRAGAMGLAGLAAIAASRPSSRAYALLLAAVVVFVWNPRASADVGAQLSFAAVLGLMAFTKPLAERLGRLPRWAAEALAATCGATLATAPLMALNFGAVSLVSLAANVLGEPLIGPIVWLGSSTAAIGQISLPLAALLNAPDEFLVGALIELAHTAASVPGAQVETAAFGPLAAAVSFAAIALLAARVHGFVPPLPRTARPAVTAAFAGALLAIVLAVVGGGGPAPIAGPAIVMLDVGQGDSTLLLGGSGCRAVIDGGPPGDGLGKKLAKLGVDRLDALLVTHPQNDHYGGALDIANAGRPRVATFLDGGSAQPGPEFTRLRAMIAREGARSIPAVAGAGWSCGDISIKVLAPAAEAPGAPPPADWNTRAAVTIVTVGGMSMLASGDAESPQLLPLALPPVEILKQPHHGSSDDGLPAVLERLHPQVALIGVGARNRFGHPTPSAIMALAAARVRVFRTDLDGTIAVRPGPGGQLAVSTTGPGR